MTKTRSFRALALLLAVLVFASLLTMGMNANAAFETLTLKEGATVTYTKDQDALKAAIIDAIVDKEASGLPEDVSPDDFTVRYPGDVAGLVDFHAGEEQNISVTYGTFGIPAYGKITIDKANVSVTVKSGSIYPDEALPENFVTTNPDDDFAIWTLYAGVTASLNPTVYLQFPQSDAWDLAMTFIDPAYALVNGGETFTQRLQRGVTVGQFLDIMRGMSAVIEKATSTELGKNALEAAGFDAEFINGLLDAMANFPDIADDWAMAIGVPNRSGLYTVCAVAMNRNYNPGFGFGLLLVKLRISGVSLVWNDTATSVSAADVASHDFGAVTWYDGKAFPNQPVKYSFIGLKSAGGLYAGMDAPTEPGTYLQTAFNLGGNFFAIPQIRSITITE